MRILMSCFLFFAIQVLVYYMLSPTNALSLTSYTDKLSLLALKEKLTNGVPDSLPSWNESQHFCDWQGVTCGHRHMRVTVLHFENQTWGGTLGPSLGNLTFLRILKLQNLALHGEIPAQIGRLKRLQILNLRNNKLQGEIPKELTNCTNINVFDLRENHLKGRVPTWFRSMKQLITLALEKNNLVGTIPSSLQNVSSLQWLALTENHLEGTIPYSIGKLSSLKLLYLALNNFSGEIPHSLYNLSNILYFDLGENDLFGSLPSNLNLIFPNLVEFLVGDNHITGNFPTSISNLTDLERIDIGENSFNGPIPNTLGRLNKLEIFSIGYNNFGSGRAHDLDFLSSLSNCTKLSILDFQVNRFGGEFPDLIGNFSTNLIRLVMQVNQIYGVIPKRIGQLTGLTYLNLANNLFEGTIPDSIGNLTNLIRLSLQENQLSGNIPTSIGNLAVLSEFYLADNKLEGRIPFTLRYCTQMQKLDICDNKLSGEIPNQTFGYLEGLINLFLYNNSLTGLIPSEFSNLKHLSQLYLHSNKLSGEIPNALASCLSLTDLGLGRNFLHGSIPLFLTSLKSLEVLDISYNNFSSTIPFQLENLTFLNYLDLSFNNLYGEVPKEGVFSNATTVSLIGNKNLCGGISELKLPPCLKTPSKKQKRSQKKKLIIVSVFSGILISFIAFMIVHFLTRKSKKLPSSPSLLNRPLRVTYGELHEATNGFSSANLVGTGSFGSVYKGSLLNFERPIAVKVLNLETRGAVKSFVAECKALGKMKHRNLVKILTCCSSVDYNGEDFKAIVFEFMSNGSLEKLLHDNEGSENHSLSLLQRVDIALDVAHALDYLHHDEDQVVVHCDIKPSNVLLDEDIVAHLGDFGLARLIHGAAEHSSKDQVSSSTIKGTIGYLPPEYGAGGPVSSQGDIYSYGILLLEMLTGKRPIDNMFCENVSLHQFCKMKIPEQILEVVDQRLLEPFVEDQTGIVENKVRKCLVMFTQIGVACSEEFPNQRMLIKDVIVRLNEIKSRLP
ncbi:probable LRR receptor-like serine/threonine-protein kinase At3g47570 [Vicia villosa]|uniref:probable LRR receptor-like serine/threonine-protein kinase At3g47570 n=1 Tax=Vicia villosa TaxID=3911 RepID=UPI00273C2C4C|nr:probable LRR receptor-like serine/threonine-protein kinase At3g47570 [Vicia villosa]XP_058744870.1 probable LRR receptor-like serine/threonine-protein kinase At3g47570 [Vicia villosa]